MLIVGTGYEEEDLPQRRDYYEEASYDDGYSPSPPRASGGAYYPNSNHFPPPPPAPPAGGYTQTTQTTSSTTRANDYPAHPPYNPADFPQTPNDPYHPPRGRGRDGDNVSSIPEAGSPTPPTPFSYPHTEMENEPYTPSPQPHNAPNAVYPESAFLSFCDVVISNRLADKFSTQIV